MKYNSNEVSIQEIFRYVESKLSRDGALDVVWMVGRRNDSLLVTCCFLKMDR
jgi:hypothetical protein